MLAQDDPPACTLANAVYDQPGTAWVLQFKPVAPDAASNQRNAFSMAIPGTGKVIEGGVYIPNGFSTAWGHMNIDCDEFTENRDQKPGCDLWQQTVYGLGATGIAPLEPQDTAPPLQILFPELGSTLWYSYHPDIQFRDIIPGDAFTFRGCAS